MSGTRKTLLISFAEKYTLLLIGIASTTIMARLLTPAQIGIFSVGAVVVGIANLMRDFGVGQYLIQEPDLSTEKIRAAFTLTLLIAWGVAGLLVLLSGAAARFYAVPEVGSVLRVLALNCLLIPFGSITLSCLRRQMKFWAIYCINVASGLTNFVVCVTLAMAGFGFMSLAWATVAGTGAAVLASLYFRPKEMPWRPGCAEMRKVLSFGAYATGSNVLDESGIAAPDLIIGKVIGMEAVGLFSKAQGVVGIFNQLISKALTPVILPLYSAQVRDGQDMKQAYLKTISYMAALSWPFFAVLSVLAFPCVRLLYGDQWDAAVPLVRIICMSAAIFSLFNMARDLFVAMGHVKKRARLEMITVPLGVVAIAVAAPLGLEAVAWSIVITSALKSMLIYRYLEELTGLRLGDLGRAVIKSGALTVLSVLVPVIVMQTMPVGSGHLLAPIAVAAIGASAFWVMGIFLLNHEIKQDLLSAIRKVLRMWRTRPAEQ